MSCALRITGTLPVIANQVSPHIRRGHHMVKALAVSVGCYTRSKDSLHSAPRLLFCSAVRHFSAKEIKEVLAIDGNRACSDCCNQDVVYADTINGGVYCTSCAAIHYELGIHCNFVPLTEISDICIENLKFLRSMGNTQVNSIYEACLDITNLEKPTLASPREETVEFIRKKYLDCAFSIARFDPQATACLVSLISDMRSSERISGPLVETKTEKNTTIC